MIMPAYYGAIRAKEGAMLNVKNMRIIRVLL